jgi:hypothetical protein
LGGGGGTKVFCSQALKIPNAARAKATRQTVAPFCPAALYDLKRAGERKAFIFSCPDTFFLQKAFNQKSAFRHPIKIATIRLQWNRKPKMMRPVSNLYCSHILNFSSVEAAASSDGKSI